MTAARSQVPVTVTLPGRAVAFQQAAITPKVGGEVREVAYEPDFSAAPATVARFARPGDVVLTMGAGSVTMLAGEILTELGS